MCEMANNMDGFSGIRGSNTITYSSSGSGGSTILVDQHHGSYGSIALRHVSKTLFVLIVPMALGQCQHDSIDKDCSSGQTRDVGVWWQTENLYLAAGNAD